jgi:hypothetical protein
MKVYIGPYKNWIGPYQFIKIFKPLFSIFSKNEEKWESFEDWFSETKFAKIFNFINKIKPDRKINIRIDDYDVWSLDNTLARIIHPCLIKLKENLHGGPSVDDEDVPDDLKRTSARPLTQKELDSGSVDENWFKRWEYVLDEMIYAFVSELHPDWDSQYETGVSDFSLEKDENTGLTSFKLGPKHTLETDTESMEKAWDRRKNGLRLFGKYYHNLWD